MKTRYVLACPKHNLTWASGDGLTAKCCPNGHFAVARFEPEEWWELESIARYAYGGSVWMSRAPDAGKET